MRLWNVGNDYKKNVQNESCKLGAHIVPSDQRDRRFDNTTIPGPWHEFWLRRWWLGTADFSGCGRVVRLIPCIYPSEERLDGSRHCVLVPKLLQHGHRVVVLDLFPCGDDIFETYQHHENLRQISGDFTDPATLANALRGCDAVIHLACVTGRTGYEPDPALEKATNMVAFGPLVEMSKTAGVKRFIFASSLRGKNFGSMTAPTSRQPLDETDEFLIHKERCEHLLEEARSPGFVVCTIRAAVVYGVAPSQRLDSGFNALAWEGCNSGGIRILDGDRQMIPNIHVEDLASFYLIVLNQPDARIDGKCCEANSENLTRLEMATVVATALDNDVLLDVEAGVDLVDPEIPCGNINPGFGFEAKHSVEDAVRELVASLQDGIIEPLPKKLKKCTDLKQCD